MDRRQFLAGALGATGAVTVGAFAVSSPAATSPYRSGPSVGLEPVASGFREPVDLETARDDRLMYVADKYGKIYVRDGDGVADEPFLDIADQLAKLETWEEGLVGLVLHPDFESNRKFYVRYSSPPREGTPDDYNHTFVLSEFRAREDLRRADPDSERPILELPEPGPNHNSGALAFGPDGYLYVGTGDGSSKGADDAGLGHAPDWYWLNRGGNGQNVESNLLGSILRIDVDSETSQTSRTGGGGTADSEDGKPYAIPDDNPLVGEDGLDEQYAWGFRNPYRMSFTDGELYVGDVGSGAFEEIDIVRKGGNYGWNVKEGERCFTNRLPMIALAKLPLFNRAYPVCPDSTSDGEPLIDPIVAYPHRRNGEPFGRAVVGGFRYTAGTVSALQDAFVFGDLLGRGSGLYTATPPNDGDGLWTMSSIEVTADLNMTKRYVLSLGRDSAGELYVLTTQFAEGSGAVHRIVPADR